MTKMNVKEYQYKNLMIPEAPSRANSDNSGEFMDSRMTWEQM